MKSGIPFPGRAALHSDRPYLRDRNDEMVLELGVAAQCGYIITYNQRDFRGADKFGIRVLDARTFPQEIGELP